MGDRARIWLLRLVLLTTVWGKGRGWEEAGSEALGGLPTGPPLPRPTAGVASRSERSGASEMLVLGHMIWVLFLSPSLFSGMWQKAYLASWSPRYLYICSKLSQKQTCLLHLLHAKLKLQFLHCSTIGLEQLDTTQNPPTWSFHLSNALTESRECAPVTLEIVYLGDMRKDCSKTDFMT